MSAIVAALSFGAAAFTAGALNEAGKDAYEALKSAVMRITSPGDIQKLEENPNSQSRQGVITEELEKANVSEDPELAALAEALLAALKETGKSTGAIGVSIEDVEAINVRLQRITASGTGASIKKSKLAGDIEISDIDAGATPGKQ